MDTLAFINASIFFVLSALHFFWAAGGKWGKVAIIPTREKTGEKLFSPSVFSTLVVAVGLFVFGTLSLGTIGLIPGLVNVKYFLTGNLLIGIIFLARAVGDFRYLGLSKRITDTAFAKNDSRYYVPLSAFLSLNSFLIFACA